MYKVTVVKCRKATSSDLAFLSEILVNAAAASGVQIQVNDLSDYPDSYAYVEEFPKGADVGVVAETAEGYLAGAAWIRLLPTDIHAVNEPLPELTMGVISEYQRRGIGELLLEELYEAASVMGISKFHVVISSRKIN